MRKVLIKKKKNSAPNTEFEIQNYKLNSNNKYEKDGNPYKGTNEKDIIYDIELNKNDIYRTDNKGNDTLTEVEVKGKSPNKYLSSINNKTNKDNITYLEEYD